MTEKQLRRTGRGAFTLIELLIVIAIITLLVSLTTAAVIRVLTKVEEVKTRSDISQFAVAIQNFETKYNVDYIPSKIALREDGTYDLTIPLQADTYAYLVRVWPRLAPTGVSPGVTYPVDWNGNGAIDAGPVVLNGDQCLVFFLGGIGGTQGFATNPINPGQLVDPTTGKPVDRVSPFYEFQTSRLVYIDPTTYQVTKWAQGLYVYWSYLDPYGKQPYAYFSSYKAANGYNRYGSTDCPTLNLGAALPPSPYYDPTNNNTFFNRNTFQIISAGKDQVFGPGGGWVQSQAETIAPNGSAEADDMANFYDKKLGIP